MFLSSDLFIGFQFFSLKLHAFNTIFVRELCSCLLFDKMRFTVYFYFDLCEAVTHRVVCFCVCVARIVCAIL